MKIYCILFVENKYSTRKNSFKNFKWKATYYAEKTTERNYLRHEEYHIFKYHEFVELQDCNYFLIQCPLSDSARSFSAGLNFQYYQWYEHGTSQTNQALFEKRDGKLSSRPSSMPDEWRKKSRTLIISEKVEDKRMCSNLIIKV